jgi:HD superfamily phosphohydrolase
MAGATRAKVRAAGPRLTAGVDALCQEWLRPLSQRLDTADFRPKQINDAVWGTVELLPWEVALLDTPLLQRMRGVRQLGLAHLVFPGAVHDRLEHIVGVVGAVELMVSTIERQIARWNRDTRNRSRPLPPIEPHDRHRLRLAALFHDLGHGPFSHAIEPVLEVVSPLGMPTPPDDGGWRSEIAVVREVLKAAYLLNEAPSVSEIMAVMIILSETVHLLLASDRLITERWASAPDLQEQLVACVVGAIEGPGADHLSSIVSSQLDADRMDYLSRDSHHSGLTIGFDTDRLLSRLEVLQMRQDNTPGADVSTRERISRHGADPTLQIGIAASGFGSFEQMLIGRTFLYDRLYHHHKVRAAEAMAQRMLLIAERDRGKQLSLGEIFLSVSDDTMVRILAEEVTHPRLETKSPPAARLARGLVNRQLLHRAYAFRARFVSTPPGIDKQLAEATRNEQWRRLLKSLDTLGDRYEVGVSIHALALQAADALQRAAVDVEAMQRYKEELEYAGSEQIIVDLPKRKADAIRIMARYPDGTLKVPEFSFNPVKWADAYDLQKRTGYVFCPRDLVPIVALAAGILFMTRYGVVMSADADGYIKAGRTVSSEWVAALVTAGIVDQEAADQLQSKRQSLLIIRREDLRVPSNWIEERTDFAVELAAGVKSGLRSGLTAGALSALSEVMEAMFAFMDMWYAGNFVSGPVKNEADLQDRLRDHLIPSVLVSDSQGIPIERRV